MPPLSVAGWMRSVALAGLLWLALGALAQAQDFIAQRAWLEDPGGRMAWSDARQQPAQPFAGTLSRGYGRGTLWLRLRIDPHADGSAPAPGDTLVLRIRPAYLDEVQVWDALVSANIPAGVAGDRHHPRLDALQGTDFLLPIARGDAPRDVWLRLSTTSTRQIHVQALRPGTLGASAARQTLAVGLYIGMLLVLTVWGLVTAALRREPVMLFFAAMQGTGALFALSTLGLLRVLWPPGWSAAALDLASSVLSIVVVGAGLAFHVRFLREFRPPGWVMGLLHAALALVPVNLALLAASHVRWALQSNMVSILLAPPLCLLAALSARAWRAGGEAAARPALPHRVVVGFYVLLLLIFLLASTTGLGWLPATQWTMYVSQLQGLVSSVLLALMLHYRAHVRDGQRQQAVLLLEATRLQVAHERQMRQEQERLLLMLAHEIKTPLATMHLRLDSQARGAPAICQAMREMNAVIERCLQTLKTDGGQLVPHLLSQDVVKVVRDAVGACSQPERVELDVPSSLHMTTDAQLLFIVLSNLLENACAYSAPGTPIVLRCAVHTETMLPTLRLELSNLPGQAGWPDEVQVFDKYYRAPQAQRQSGTGLGLYLAQSLAHALEGTVTYVPGDGQVRFVLTLALRPMARVDR